MGVTLPRFLHPPPLIPLNFYPPTPLGWGEKNYEGVKFLGRPYLRHNQCTVLSIQTTRKWMECVPFAPFIISRFFFFQKEIFERAIDHRVLRFDLKEDITPSLQKNNTYQITLT